MSLLQRFSNHLQNLADDIDVRRNPTLKGLLDRAEVAFAEDRHHEALHLLARAEAENPRVGRIHLVRGLILQALQQHDEARRHLLRSIELRETFTARFTLGEIAMASSDCTDGHAHFQRALKLAGEDDERVAALGALASIHERQGARPRAIPLLRQALRIREDDPALAVRLARALHEDGDDETAWLALAPALAADPPPRDALLLGASLATGAAEAGVPEAHRLLDLLAAQEGESGAVLMQRAALLEREQRPAEALPLLIRALIDTTVDADRIGLLERIAACYRADGSRDQARETLRQAVAIEPSPRLVRQLARAELETGEARSALARLDALAESAPGIDRALQLLRGRAALALGDLEAARQALGALRSASMGPETLLALGQLALAEGDAVEALGLLREAALDPAWRSLAEAPLAEALAALAPDLPDPGSVDALGPARLAPFLDALAPVIAAHPLLSPLLPRATALRQQLDAPLTVAVLGEFNAGKSTLINAFVAEEMVATGVLPTTSHVNVIRYGPRPVARWTRTDGAVEELPFAEAATLVRQRPEEIAELEFCYPHPELRSIHFWDTPGFNAPVDEHEQRAGRALQTADAILWLLDAHQALTATEFSRLEEITRPRERLLIVINKIDRLGRDAEEAVQAIRGHLEDHLDGRYAGIFPLSALQALEARRQGEDEGSDGAGEGWRVFELALRERFFARAGRLKSLEVAVSLTGLADDALARAAAALDAVATAREGIRQRREALGHRAARWETRVLTPAREELQQALQALRTRTAAEIVDLVGSEAGLLGRRRLEGEDRRLLSQQLRDRTRALLDAARQRLMEDVRRTEEEVVRTVEQAATLVGPPESRTLRRRLEAWLAEARALERLLDERAGQAPYARLIARLEADGDRVLEEVAAATSRTEGEREALLRRLLPDRDDLDRERLLAWGEEYAASALRLCEHAERDLELLTLDIDHRIVRPFRATAAALRPLGAAAVTSPSD
ncbi:MAG: hypothetical protein EA398_04880 [Deltaproteobacteria bacterium]|nr:MAG: hypothetical protein EA398_04880 [Deltaproteobacteria bacterium]